MNGMEQMPDCEEKFRLSRPYYVFRLQLVVRKDETRIESLEDCKKPGIRVGTLGDTAASRLLTERNIPFRNYDSQTTPYKDLEQNELDAVLWDLPIAAGHKANPEFSNKLKFVGKPILARFLRLGLPQGERGPGRAVRRGHRAALRRRHIEKDFRQMGT